MYALTYCYEGVDDNYPFAQTIAVSENIDTLRKEMEKCIEEDTQENEDDEWDDSCNFQVYERVVDNQSICMVSLQHKARINLYTKYVIKKVKEL
jgi:hypothetical protein